MENNVISVSKKVSWLLVFTFSCICLVALTSYTKYIYAQDFTLRIEAPCNPEEGICYVRDCDEYCPPNGLGVYSVFKISASKYDECENNSCENICRNEDSKQFCLEIKCGEESIDDCTN